MTEVRTLSKSLNLQLLPAHRSRLLRVCMCVCSLFSVVCVCTWMGEIQSTNPHIMSFPFIPFSCSLLIFPLCYWKYTQSILMLSTLLFTNTLLLISVILLLKNTQFLMILCYSKMHTHSPTEIFNPFIQKYTKYTFCRLLLILLHNSTHTFLLALSTLLLTHKYIQQGWNLHTHTYKARTKSLSYFLWN